MKMKFFLDENVPRSVLGLLQEYSFEVEHASETLLRGASDKDIANYARKNNAILITKDLEFGSSILYPKGSHYGVLILRLPYHFTADKIKNYLRSFLARTNPIDLVNTISILELGRYRRRWL